MCTVTYIPIASEHFILTSNRDESALRATEPPREYEIAGSKMIFPKDKLAGGTWIGVSDKNRLICLLNGGFENHTRKASYRMSRGVIVKTLLASENLEETLNTFDFSDIEPFTIVAIDWNGMRSAYELVWDGAQAHLQTLEDRPYIWSSSTLYTADMKAKRQAWFAEFKEQQDLSPQALLQFHTLAGEGDPATNVCLDRGILRTVSITQVEKTSGTCHMRYHDLLSEKKYERHLENVCA